MHFWIAFQAFLFAVVVPVVTYLLKAFGIGSVVFIGLSIVITQLKDFAISHMNGLPADVLGILGIMQADVALNIIVSSVLARAILSGLNSSTGKMKKFTLEA